MSHALAYSTAKAKIITNYYKLLQKMTQRAQFKPLTWFKPCASEDSGRFESLETVEIELVCFSDGRLLRFGIVAPRPLAAQPKALTVSP